MCNTTTTGKKIQKMALTAVLLGLGGIGMTAVSVPAALAAPAAAPIAAVPAQNAPVGADDARKQAEAYFNGINTVVANFTQQSTGEAFTQEGTFTLKKPKQFVWQYTSPDAKKVISNGHGLYFVDDARHQVSQLPNNAGLARFFNSGSDFTLAKAGVKVAQAYRNGNVLTINLTATEKMAVTPQAGLKTAQMVFSTGGPASTGGLQLKHISALDTLGTTTSVTFSNIKTDVSVPDSAFAFALPKAK